MHGHVHGDIGYESEIGGDVFRPRGKREVMHHLFLTFLIPGYRALRRGDKRRAHVFQALFVCLFAFALFTPWLASAVGALLFGVSFVVLSVLATRRGPAAGDPARLRGWEWAWLVGPQVLVLLVIVIPSLRRPLVGLEVFMTPTRSNAPTIDAGDRFVVALRDKFPVRGEMVVFRSPDGTGRNFIKRIVAVGGDVVEGGAAGVKVNGCRLRDTAVEPFGPVTVPAGHAFVVGDNLGNSLDSRHFGAIQEEAITGRPLYVVWSKQWRKIGRRLR